MFGNLYWVGKVWQFFRADSMVNLWWTIIKSQVGVWNIYQASTLSTWVFSKSLPTTLHCPLTFCRVRCTRPVLVFDWSWRHFVHLSTLRTRHLVSPSSIAGASLEAARPGSVAVASQDFTVKMHYWMVFNKTKRLDAKTLFGADGVRIIEGRIQLTSAAKQREL